MKPEIYLAFDIDGTIYNAGDILEDSFRESIDRFLENGSGKSLKAPLKKEIQATLGYPVEEIIRMLFPSLTAGERNEVSAFWTASLVGMIRRRRGILIEWVQETLAVLNSMNCGMLVASNGEREYVEAILQTYDIRKYFSGPFLFPGGDISDKSDIVRIYLDAYPGKKIIMIGDRITDLDAAADNDIPFIGCAFGHAGMDEIAGEQYIVRRFDEIPETVIKISKDKKWNFHIV